VLKPQKDICLSFAINSELLQRYRHEGDDFFLHCIVTGDESWFHHFEPETKQQSMEWHHLHSPPKKKAETVPSAVFENIMEEEKTYGYFMQVGATVHTANYSINVLN
jgi:hypothetical protein